MSARIFQLLLFLLLLLLLLSQFFFYIFRRRFHIRFVAIYGIDLVFIITIMMAFKTMKRSWLLDTFSFIFFCIFSVALKLFIIIKMENLIVGFQNQENAKHEKKKKYLLRSLLNVCQIQFECIHLNLSWTRNVIQWYYSMRFIL